MSRRGRNDDKARSSHAFILSGGAHTKFEAMLNFLACVFRDGNVFSNINVYFPHVIRVAFIHGIAISSSHNIIMQSSTMQ